MTVYTTESYSMWVSVACIIYMLSRWQHLANLILIQMLHIKLNQINVQMVDLGKIFCANSGQATAKRKYFISPYETGAKGLLEQWLSVVFGL